MLSSTSLAIKELEESKEKLIKYSLTTYSWFEDQITDIDHQDPIWYDGAVWEIQMMNRFRIVFMAVGEVNMSWNDDEERTVISTSHGEEASERRKWLHEHGIIVDSDIYMSDELYISKTNHYELWIWDTKTGDAVYSETEWKMDEYGLPLECEPEWLYSKIKDYLGAELKKEEVYSVFSISEGEGVR